MLASITNCSKLWLCCRRTHQSLASVGVAALVRLVTSAGTQMSSSMWQETIDMVAQAVGDTVPHVAELVSPPPRYPSSPTACLAIMLHRLPAAVCANQEKAISYDCVSIVVCAELLGTSPVGEVCVVAVYPGRKV